jgi:hypothetical protein
MGAMMAGEVNGDLSVGAFETQRHMRRGIAKGDFCQ